MSKWAFVFRQMHLGSRCWKNVLVTSFCFLSAIVAQGNGTEAKVKGQFAIQGEALHLEFSGREDWDYELKRVTLGKDTAFEVTIPELDSQSRASLAQFTNPLVKSVKIQPKAIDEKDKMVITLKTAAVESFDYLTDQPSRLIIDVYPMANKKNSNEKASKGPAKSTKAVVEKLPSPSKTKVSSGNVEGIDEFFEDSQEKSENGITPQARKIASDIIEISKQGTEVDGKSTEAKGQEDRKSGIFDGADPAFDRFSMHDFEVNPDAIIRSRENIYLPFPPLKNELTHLKDLEALPPTYEVIPQDTEENKQMRLLQTLFSNHRNGVFLKTVEWFFTAYPESKYDEMLRFMIADTYYDIWKKTKHPETYAQAIGKYRAAIEKYPKSPLLERTVMLMGFAALDRGDVLSTLQIFKKHLRDRPASENKDVAQLALAEGFLKLNRYEDAAEVFDQIESTGSTDDVRVEAGYQRGDVYFKQKDYQAAFREYEKGLKKAPHKWEKFPNAFYNAAEALFWLGKFKLSLDKYRDFVRRFPSHPHAGYAMTRIGELLEILGADRSRVIGSYVETYFRYGETSGASVARIRLLSQKMQNMKVKEVEQSIKEINEIVKKSELVKMDEFAAIMISEGYTRRAEYEKAIQPLAQYYQNNPTTSDNEVLVSRIVKNINQWIKDEVDKGDFISALKIHNRYIGSWLKNSQRIDTNYFVGRAFEQAGAFSEAENTYKDVYSRLVNMRGTKSEKERSIFEKLPSENEVNVRLAKMALMQKRYTQAFEYGNRIKTIEHLSPEHQVERVNILAQVQEQRGDLDSAKRYVTSMVENFKGDSKLMVDPLLYLAKLEMKSKDNDKAMKSLFKIIETRENSGEVSDDNYSDALQMVAQIQLQKGEKDQVIDLYKKLLADFESKQNLSSVRFKLGDLYFEKGDLQKASEIWDSLKEAKNDFWYKLAQEKLANSQWQGDFRKYIQRIPAMANKDKPVQEVKK